MTKSPRTRYAPGYDLFKLIVAVILTVILVWLLLQENRRRYEQLEMLPTLANTPTMQVASTVTKTTVGAATETDIPTTATITPTQPTASPTEEPTPVTTPSTPTSEPSPSPEADACPSNPTQIEVGDTVKVLDWLNFRVGPGLSYPIQHTNRPGTEMEVIGGPVCTLKDGDPPRAYLWWNVRLGNGKEGWSAEAPLNFPNYFMEPAR